MTQETYNALNDEERELVDEIGMDNLDDNVEFIRCARCGSLMVEDTEEHNTRLGCICGECYDDLFG